MSETFVALGAFAAGMVLGILVQHRVMTGFARKAREASDAIDRLVKSIDEEATRVAQLARELGWLHSDAGKLMHAIDELKRELERISSPVEESVGVCEDLDKDIRRLIDLVEKKIRWTINVNVAAEQKKEGEKR